MDDSKEGVLLIATTMVVLVAFSLTVLAVMLIYRKRKVEHIHEISRMNEKFARELLEAQLEVQRQTMQYIGREIHDNVGQQLTLASLYTQQLDSRDVRTSTQIESIGKIIDESLADLRNLSRSLTNSAVGENDLDKLIDLECTKVRSAKVCEVTFRCSAARIESSDSVKSFVLRILQEFVQNSLKHSKCTAIFVELSARSEGVMLTAIDNGKGFSGLNNPGGSGLANMKERAAMMGADINIESAEDAGTRLQLFIPTQQLMFNHATQYRHRG
ncbi:MAG TPA: ATP-binding protein [Chryseosolibacter sp.]|nr:ATP-binding protein [Chryseosolibacter sp.]